MSEEDYKMAGVFPADPQRRFCCNKRWKPSARPVAAQFCVPGNLCNECRPKYTAFEEDAEGRARAIRKSAKDKP